MVLHGQLDFINDGNIKKKLDNLIQTFTHVDNLFIHEGHPNKCLKQNLYWEFYRPKVHTVNEVCDRTELTNNKIA